MSDSSLEIRAAAAVLFRPDQVVEVRLLNTRDRTVSGYFDDHDLMATAIRDAAAAYADSSVYWTLNELNPRCLARAANRLRKRANDTTSGRDVIRRRWLPIDIDPVRPSGVSSTDEEVRAAGELGRLIAAAQKSEWGDPDVFACSGNGAHLLYSIDMPNDDDAKRRVEQTLIDLDARFSTDVVKVDTSPFDANRIWKVYGTVARKGDDILSSPWRKAQILSL